MDKFEPDYLSIDAFGVWMDRTTFHLALAVIDRMENLGLAGTIELLKAANALRTLAGGVPTKPTEETRKWNEEHRPGTAIVVNNPNCLSFIAVTTSPAFDTPLGPHVMVEDNFDAVPLHHVSVYSGSAAGVLS